MIDEEESEVWDNCDYSSRTSVLSTRISSYLIVR
jgi:hypothetical protein